MNMKNGFGSSDDFRSMSESEVIKWVNEWNDSGLASWDIIFHMGILLILLIPMVFIYWSSAMLVVNSRYRRFIRSGHNGMPIFSFIVGFTFMTLIANEIFYCVLFSSPAWASFYHYAGAETVIDIENRMYVLRLMYYVFG